MKSYLDLVQQVFDQGQWQANRTGIRTLSLPGAMLRLDLAQGFPAVTTKKLAFRTAIGELVGFLRAADNAAAFRELGCRVWDQNANETPAWLANPWRRGEDDLGPVYGVQWRHWPAYKDVEAGSAAAADAEARGYQPLARLEGAAGEAPRLIMRRQIDQLRQCLETIHTNPTDRRILFHGWNCAELDQMALPPCHLLYQFLPQVASREISLCLYVRSNDLGLGTPFNLAEGAALLHLVGRLTGYRPRWFSYFVGDAHIYETHVDMLREQLTREPYPLPRLELSDRIPAFEDTGRFEPEWLERVRPDDFNLVGYQHHPPLTAPMAA